MEHLFARTPDFGCLSDPEASRAKGMQERRREQFVLGRTALRTLAGRILGIAPRDVPLEISSSGAPILRGGGLHLSLSHSGGAALAVVAGSPAGCDLESLLGPAKDFPALAERFFHPSESLAIRKCPPEDRQSLFLASWTRKEAAFKCGILDWSRCLGHPWVEGDNDMEAGTMALGAPDGLPEGWIGTLSLWRPNSPEVSQRARMGNLAEPPSHDRT
jgi:4'-phosphopantetheinyl transferase